MFSVHSRRQHCQNGETILQPLHLRGFSAVSKLPLPSEANKPQKGKLGHYRIPRDIDLQTWRVISWPLVGCLFWWVAGRGIEGLIAARRRLILPRITWIETIPSGALCLFCAVASVCLPMFSGHDGDFPMKLFVAGLGMWAVLGGAVVAARVAQWRIRKGESLTDGAATSPA